MTSNGLIRARARNCAAASRRAAHCKGSAAAGKGVLHWLHMQLHMREQSLLMSRDPCGSRVSDAWCMMRGATRPSQFKLCHAMRTGMCRKAMHAACCGAVLLPYPFAIHHPSSTNRFPSPGLLVQVFRSTFARNPPGANWGLPLGCQLVKDVPMSRAAASGKRCLPCWHVSVALRAAAGRD